MVNMVLLAVVGAVVGPQHPWELPTAVRRKGCQQVETGMGMPDMMRCRYPNGATRMIVASGLDLRVWGYYQRGGVAWECVVAAGARPDCAYFDRCGKRLTDQQMFDTHRGTRAGRCPVPSTAAVPEPAWLFLPFTAARDDGVSDGKSTFTASKDPFTIDARS